MKKLYRFYWDCGRQGDVEGIFVATIEEIEQAIGKSVQFGEILGKHSNIYGNLELKDLQILTDDQDFIEKAEKYGLLPTGHNPMNYIEEE